MPLYQPTKPALFYLRKLSAQLSLADLLRLAALSDVQGYDVQAENLRKIAKRFATGDRAIGKNEREPLVFVPIHFDANDLRWLAELSAKMGHHFQARFLITEAYRAATTSDVGATIHHIGEGIQGSKEA